MTRTARSISKLLIASACLLLLFAQSRAQDSGPSDIHWAYGAYFGTGWYQINDRRDVYVIRYSPRWEMREADFADDGTRKTGIEFRFPITFGLDNFSYDDLPGSIDPNNLSSLSVTPGIDITIPVNKNWSLRPFAAIGWGSTFDNSESVWTYWAGVKSRYAFQHGKLDWALLNSITYVGQTPSVGRADDFWPLMAGLEFDYPLGQHKLAGEQLFLSWHGLYTTFENDLEDVIENPTTEPVTDQWELGMSLHKEESRIKILWFKFDRLGLAYRFSTSGDFKGISFVFRSYFDS